MSAEKKPLPLRGQGRPGLPSWCYELAEPHYSGDWRLPDPAQERLDDLERYRERDERGVQEFH